MTTTCHAVGEPRTATIAGEFLTGPVGVGFTPASIPGTGVLVLSQKRLVTTYALGPVPCDDGGRGFRLVKVGGGSDKDMSAADVLRRADGTFNCCCRGFQRWLRCKHTAACELVHEWLPEPRIYDDRED